LPRREKTKPPEPYPRQYMTLLLTGYEPFGDHDRNPSAEVARKLDGTTVAEPETSASHEIVGRVLPVEFDRAAEEMRDLIEAQDPDAVVATGLAAGRTAMSVERVGVNVADCAGIPDNADATPRNERIRGDGGRDGDADTGSPPAAYFATLPVVEIVEDLLGAGIPARVSNTAGTHLCNNILYETQAYLEGRASEENENDGSESEIPMGFIHLPLTPEMAAEKAKEGEAASGGAVEPSLPLQAQVEAVERLFELTLSAQHPPQ
jgi:pyroglutamyl-peptidase